MVTINEKFREKSVHSIRINDKLVEITKKTGLPLSNIIESCLINFLSLDDDDKIRLLAENNSDKVDVSQILEPKYDFAKEAIKTAKQTIGNKQSDRTSDKILIAIGLTLLAALLLTGKDNT